MNKPSSLPVAHNDTVTHEKGNSAGTVTSCPHCHGNPTSPWVSIVRMVFTWPIKFYQIVFAGAPRVCRFEPTCSQYAIEAIERHGIFKGTAMALWRVLRCNPWTPGGYDPVR